MAVTGIHFGLLSLQDALDLAVLIEEEARDRYVELSEQLASHANPEVARFFAFMADNEEKHRRELAAHRRAVFHEAPARVRREQIFDVEAPEYGEVHAIMPPRAALEIALRAEQRAYAFFDAALKDVQDPKVMALFQDLLAEERVHESLVRAQLERLPPDPIIELADVADDPHAE